MKEKKIKSSEEMVYRKYRIIELIGICFTLIGMVIAACSGFYANKGGTNHVIFVTLIIVGLIIAIASFIIFSVYYFKIKKMR